MLCCIKLRISPTFYSVIFINAWNIKQLLHYFEMRVYCQYTLWACIIKLFFLKCRLVPTSFHRLFNILIEILVRETFLIVYRSDETKSCSVYVCPFCLKIISEILFHENFDEVAAISEVFAICLPARCWMPRPPITFSCHSKRNNSPKSRRYRIPTSFFSRNFYSV